MIMHTDCEADSYHKLPCQLLATFHQTPINVLHTSGYHQPHSFATYLQSNFSSFWPTLTSKNTEEMVHPGAIIIIFSSA